MYSTVPMPLLVPVHMLVSVSLFVPEYVSEPGHVPLPVLMPVSVHLSVPRNSTNRMWFSVVCTLIDNEYASSQWSKCCGLTRRINHISICFLPQY